MSFVGLHIHSDYSLLDGASQLPNLVKRAEELGMPAIALTDHGVMYGAIELLKTTKGSSVKPIIGNEMYVINGVLADSKENPRKKLRKYHQIVLAKNKTGYQNLVNLTTISHLEGMRGSGIFSRPCIDKTLLSENAEGLIVTSACLGGEIPQAILAERLDVAERVAGWYKDVFGDDFYLELQDHGSQEDRVVNLQLVKLAKQLKIELVATNDSHFISCYDVEAHDALLCIQTKKNVTEDKRLRYSGTEYRKSGDEMKMLFRDHLDEEIIETAIANTVKVANKVEDYNILGEPRIPDFPVPPGHNADTYVEHVAWEGLIERLQVTSKEDILNDHKEYADRLVYELEMLQRMGFSAYFLVVWDYIKFARDANIPVGPGRGSAAGSLVAYCLKITNIDPVHYGLLFERFLNPERKSMPDVDTDFCIEKRDQVIDYVTQKYGEDRVAQIITFNRMTSKAVLKDVARVLEIPYGESDRMAKLIPVARGKPAKLKVMISDETPAPEFKEKYDKDSQIPDAPTGMTYRRWLEMAMRIEGTNKTFGVHAAGVVISAQPLSEVVPLQRNNDGAVITQYYMEDVEAMGLLKMDFLGLKNLTTIQKAVDLIQETRGTKVDPDAISLEDPATFQLLAGGELAGVFQLESSGMRQVVRDLKPSCLEDISSVLALYRPGPLDAGLIPMFINRKHGREQISYDHEVLEPILNETYGVLVYQEQIMKVAQDMAGYTLGEADLLRRAMGKKKLEAMKKQRVIFVDGSAKNGIKTKLADGLFDQMVKFAEYCFNKSHSTAYGYVTYQTAWLKANYPVEYMAALLTSNSGNQDKVQAYIATCLKMGIEVEPPDINRSGLDFTPVSDSNGKDYRILFGLSAVQNLGEGAIDHLVAARETDGAFESLADLCDRVDLRSVNKRALEALIHSGAFDKLDPNRRQHMEDLPLVIDWAQGRARDRASGQGNIFDLMGGMDGGASSGGGLEMAPKAPPTEDYPKQERLRLEKELLGFYVSDHPLKMVQRRAQMLAPVNVNELSDHCGSKSTVSAIVMVTTVKPVITKKGDRMAIVQVEDLTGQVEGVVFPRSFAQIGHLIEPDARLMIWGKVDWRDESVQYIIEDAEAIESVEILMVELSPEVAGEIQHRDRLRNTLLSHQGEDPKMPVVAIISDGKGQRQLVRLGSQFRVANPNTTAAALQQAGFEAQTQPLAVN